MCLVVTKGDYREEYAVVRNRGSGLCYHIDSDGKRLNDKEFWDLGVYNIVLFFLLRWCSGPRKFRQRFRGAYVATCAE